VGAAFTADAGFTADEALRVVRLAASAAEAVSTVAQRSAVAAGFMAAVADTAAAGTGNRG
jgi:hypothetical protein